ncbi:MAG: glutathione S-transferase [Gemmobacter sp.]|uniref:glutathione S-transferase n=1 Tax=Gemmobacter sp. TaxID=1898957 RepID=UPI00391A811B
MSSATTPIGDRSYSSWSLRGWLVFDAFGLPVTTQLGRLYSDDFSRLMVGFAPARTAPALRLPEGVVIAESLAIAEEIASRHPEAGHWPENPAARAVARALAAEMHAGFGALRSHCPMNLRVSYTGCEPPQAVLDDLFRLETLWAWARAATGAGGDWLCGPYSVADAFFAPVATRITTYNLPVGPAAAAYVAAHLAHPSFRRWRAMGMVDGADQTFYRRDDPTRPWPGPAPIPARATETGVPENPLCPCSGRPVSHLANIGGRTWGFCNAFCRDKTVADAGAWPDFMAIYHS